MKTRDEIIAEGSGTLQHINGGLVLCSYVEYSCFCVFHTIDY